MPPPAGAEMPPHEMNISVAMDMVNAQRQLEDLHRQHEQLSGSVGAFHKNVMKDQFSVNSLMKEQNQQIGLQIIGWKQSIAQLNAWNLGIAALSQASADISEIQKATEYMRVSAALTTKSFKELQEGIIQTSTITGQSIGEIAQKARTIYDLTGLTEGLDKVITSGSHMNRVFGMAGEEFEKFAAYSVKFSGGMTDANTLMSKFDKVVGLTGAKMSDLLTALGQISKSLFKIVGGGKNFANVIESATEFIANASSQMQRLGGDSEFIGELTNTILDTNRWDELSQTMPMFAAHAYEMQEAFASGDMEKFHKLLQDSAKETLSMTDGMNAAARSKMGIPIGDLEVLAGLDFNNLGAGADQAGKMGTVLGKSQAVMQSIGESMTRLWRNFSAVITKILLPLFEQISAGLAAVNDAMSKNQAGSSVIIEGLVELATFIGAVVKYVLLATAAFINWTGSTGAVVAGVFGMLVAWKALMYILAASVKLVAWMFGPVLQAAATGVAAAAQTTAVGVASASKIMGKAAKSMMMAGAGMAIMAGALILFAVALNLMPNPMDILKLTGAIAILLGVLTLLGVAAVYIWPFAIMFSVVAAIFAVGIGALGIALWIFGGQLETFAKQSKAIGEIATNLTKLQDLSGVIIDDTAWTAVVNVGRILKDMPEIDTDVAASMGNLAESMTILGNNIDEMVGVSAKIKTNAKELKTMMTALFDPTEGILTKTAKDIDATFSKWGFDVDLSGPLQDMGELLGFFTSLGTTLPLMAELGRSMTADVTITSNLQAMMIDLFGPDGFITYAVKTIDSTFTDWTNLAITGPLENLNQLMTFFGALRDTLPKMVAMAQVMKADKTIGTDLNTFMTSLFGSGGFIKEAVTMIDNIFTSGNLAIEGPMKNLNSLMTFFGALRKTLPKMIAMASVLAPTKDGPTKEFQNLYWFMYGLFGPTGILTKGFKLMDDYMPSGNGIDAKLKSAKSLISGIASLTTDISAIQNVMSEDVNMKVEGAASEAHMQFKTAQAEHEKRVEGLLGEIRDLLSNKQVTAVASGGGGSSSGLSLGGVFGDSDEGWS